MAVLVLVLLKDFILQSIDKHIPAKLSKRRTNQPWITPLMKRMIRRKARQYRKAKTSNSAYDWSNFKSFWNTVQKKTKAAYWSYTNRILNDPDDKHKRRFGAS